MSILYYFVEKKYFNEFNLCLLLSETHNKYFCPINCHLIHLRNLHYWVLALNFADWVLQLGK